MGGGEDKGEVARRLLALLLGQGHGQGDAAGESLTSQPPLLLERDPDVFVPTFEARGLSMDMPVVVGDKVPVVFMLSRGSCRRQISLV